MKRREEISRLDAIDEGNNRNAPVNDRSLRPT